MVAGRTRERVDERERTSASKCGKRSTNEFSSRVGRQLNKAQKLNKEEKLIPSTLCQLIKLKLIKKLITVKLRWKVRKFCMCVSV